MRGRKGWVLVLGCEDGDVVVVVVVEAAGLMGAGWHRAAVVEYGRNGWIGGVGGVKVER